jgi:hypothetical protein
MYWNLPYPYGISDIDIADLIDIDEAGIFLETVNRKYGKAFIGKKVRATGPYGHSTKWTLIMGISGGPDNERWVSFLQKAGTTILDFADFIQRIVDSIPPGNAHRRRCFIMDNLSSHTNAYIRQIVNAAGHRIVFRAPYYPVDGPIEFVFNTIEQALGSYFYTVRTDNELMQAVYTEIGKMETFVPYFVNCGYD